MVIIVQQQHVLYLPQVIACKLECPQTSPQCRKAFYCPQTFLSLYFQYRADVLNYTRFGIKKS